MEIHGLLADVNLRDPSPRLQEAPWSTTQSISNIPSFRRKTVRAASCGAAASSSYWATWRAARDTLDQIPPQSKLRSEAMVLAPGMDARN